MIDKTALAEVIQEYKATLPKRWTGKQNEFFKWRAVKHFKDIWDINAADFAKMLQNALSKTGVLLEAGAAQRARTQICQYASEAQNDVRQMFVDLFDESQGYIERVCAFKTKANELHQRIRKNDKTCFQDEHAISVYLWLRYPDKYYIYKYSVAKAANLALRANYMIAKGQCKENLNNFVNLYKQINEEIKKDSELAQLMKDNLADDCYTDDSLKTLTQDICFYIEQNPKKPIRSNSLSLNLILYGVPGTGKTYSTVNYALSIIENKELDSIKEEKRSTLMERYHQYVDKKRICFTTFHQSYGYEDFIGGLKPVEDLDRPLGFVLKWQDGVFKRFADEAKKHLDDNYVIIIDEINRGQISKIFGELITLIEEDKRKGAENEMSLKLASGYKFSVPKNLYILGTMNTADKSISLIDAALRRRFVFEEIYPDASLIEDKTLKEIFEKLNNKLQSEFKSTDFLIGHAYFIGRTTDELAVIMNNKIIPLLYEYYFDKEEKVKELLKEVLGSTDFEIDGRNFGRLRIRQKLSI